MIEATLNETTRPVFLKQDDFAETVKSRVNQYFSERGLSPNCNSLMIAKTVLYLSTYVAIYLAIMLQWTGPLGMFLLCLLLGFNSALIGFNIGHDAIHGSYSSKPWVNKVLSHTFSILGAYPNNWAFTHNIVHHTYTNIYGADGDYDSIFLLRYNSTKPRKWYHRFQHVYCVLLYAIFTLEWTTKRDFQQVFKKSHLIYKKPPPSKAEIAQLFTVKLVYFTVFIGLPILVLDVAWWQVLVGFVAMHAVIGLCLTFVFQLAHLNPKTMEGKVGSDGTLPDAYFAHQLKASANFSSRNPVTSFLTGGLNCQIEHHLFPKVCSIHYSAIAPIVERTAKEFGLPYYNYETYLGAVRGHFDFLYKLGHVT